jgi:EAL domain-containing protein (putative c-di-GMP-specific phosphodiesterase class I)
MAMGRDFTAAVSEVIDPTLLMQRVTDRTLDLVAAADGVMVGVADERGVCYVCGAGQCVPFVGTRVDLDSSLSGLAVTTGQILRSDDTANDPRVDAEACRRLSVASLVCIPLRRMHQTMGVLAVNAARPNAFSDDDVAALTRLAHFVSVAVGSAWDLSRASTQLLEFGQDLDRPATARATSSPPAEGASRFVMSVLSPDTVTRIDARHRMQAILDDPVALSLVYQPIVDLPAGRVVALEALARINVEPMRPPNEWFDDAHQVGLGVELEVLAVTRALAQLDRLPEPLAVTINVGPQTILSPQLVDALREAPARRIVLELTEHTDVEDYPGLTSALQTLRRRGARVAVDDAGSGYSSLAHILKLAPDYIKLDRELISGIDLDPVRRALAGSLVAFAADTGAEILAEGVETADELDAVRRLGIRYAQGYHLGRPAPLDVLVDLDAKPPATRSRRP